MKNNQTKLREKIKNFEEKNNSTKKVIHQKNFNVGTRISIDLVATLVVSILIGLGIDKIFSTHPIFFIIFCY